MATAIGPLEQVSPSQRDAKPTFSVDTTSLKAPKRANSPLYGLLRQCRNEQVNKYVNKSTHTYICTYTYRYQAYVCIYTRVRLGCCGHDLHYHHELVMVVVMVVLEQYGVQCVVQGSVEALSGQSRNWHKVSFKC